MKNIVEKIYVTLKLIQISRQNTKRNKFYRKYCFDDYGEDLDNSCLVHAKVDEKGLKQDDQKYYSTDNKISTNDYGLKYYCHQTAGYCEDCYSGTIFYLTPIKGLFVRVHFDC